MIDSNYNFFPHFLLMSLRDFACSTRETSSASRIFFVTLLLIIVAVVFAVGGVEYCGKFFKISLSLSYRSWFGTAILERLTAIYVYITSSLTASKTGGFPANALWCFIVKSHQHINLSPSFHMLLYTNCIFYLCCCFSWGMWSDLGSLGRPLPVYFFAGFL